MTTILIFVFLIFLSAFFSSSETAFFSLSQAKVHLMQSKKKKCSNLVHKLKSNPHRLLITILIGNNIVNLFTASYATVVATDFFDSSALGIATGATTLAILIFGEIIPKSFAYAKNVLFSQISAWPIYICSIAFFPIAWFLDFISKLLQRVAGVEGDGEIVTEEEVKFMSKIGAEQGKIDKREHEMIENVFGFDKILAKDIMTKWEDVVVLSGVVPVEQIAHFVSQDSHSRYPVYDGKNEENIIGYVHLKHVMKALNSDDRDRPLSDFVIPIRKVSANMTIERIFKIMLKDRSHSFLIYGDNRNDMVGLLTLENVIEEILGEIRDETDHWTVGD